MQPKARRGDLDLGQIVRIGPGQVFHKMHRDHDGDAAAQAHHEAVLAGVIFGTDGIAVAAQLLALANGRLKLLLRNLHEWRSIAGRGWTGARPSPSVLASDQGQRRAVWTRANIQIVSWLTV